MIESLKEDDIVLLFKKIKMDLEDINAGREKNWRFDLYKKGKSDQAPGLGHQDLPFNIYLGSFTDEHHDIILNQLNISIPTTESECLLKVLFPEAFIRMTREALHITLQEAEEFLKV